MREEHIKYFIHAECFMDYHTVHKETLIKWQDACSTKHKIDLFNTLLSLFCDIAVASLVGDHSKRMGGGEKELGSGEVESMSMFFTSESDLLSFSPEERRKKHIILWEKGLGCEFWNYQ